MKKAYIVYTIIVLITTAWGSTGWVLAYQEHLKVEKYAYALSD